MKMESKGIEITRFGKQPKVYKVYEWKRSVKILQEEKL